MRVRPAVRAGRRRRPAQDDSRQYAHPQSRPRRAHNARRKSVGHVRFGREHTSFLQPAGCLGPARGDVLQVRHQAGRRHRQPHRSVRAPAGDHRTLPGFGLRSRREQLERQGARTARRKPDSCHCRSDGRRDVGGRRGRRALAGALPRQDRRSLRVVQRPRQVLVRPRVLHESGGAAGPGRPGLVLRPRCTARRRGLRCRRPGVAAGEHPARGVAEGEPGRPRRHFRLAGGSRRTVRANRGRWSGPGDLEPGQRVRPDRERPASGQVGDSGLRR